MPRNVLRSAGAGLLAAVLAVAAVLVGPGTAAVSAATPIRVMPLGDSITGSPGCWRALLWNQLRSAGIETDFVGTLPAQGCAVAYDGDNEGHGGILATNMADQSQLPPWLAATRPDIVIMHLGTNDVWSNRPTATILTAFGTLVDQMRASNPAMRILIAQILPMSPATCPDCGARVVALNNAIPAWAAAKTTGASPITVVDQWTGFSTSADTSDGVHPVDSGNTKIAGRWLGPLTAAILGTPPPSTPPPSTPPPSTPPPSTPPPAGGCTAAYQLVGQWPGGFQGEVTVRNGGGSASRSWSVRLSFPDGQTVGQVWGGTLTLGGDPVTVGNVAYNGAVPAGGSVTFGFIGSWTGANRAPAAACTLG